MRPIPLVEPLLRPNLCRTSMGSLLFIWSDVGMAWEAATDESIIWDAGKLVSVLTLLLRAKLEQSDGVVRLLLHISRPDTIPAIVSRLFPYYCMSHWRGSALVVVSSFLVDNKNIIYTNEVSECFINVFKFLKIQRFSFWLGWTFISFVSVTVFNLCLSICKYIKLRLFTFVMFIVSFYWRRQFPLSL